MRMGIKEFRERISEVTAAGLSVLITNHGKPVGHYAPFKPKDPQKVRNAAAAVAKAQADLRAKGIEPHDLLTEMGLDPWGAPLDECTDR